MAKLKAKLLEHEEIQRNREQKARAVYLIVFFLPSAFRFLTYWVANSQLRMIRLLCFCLMVMDEWTPGGDL